MVFILWLLYVIQSFAQCLVVQVVLLYVIYLFSSYNFVSNYCVSHLINQIWCVILHTHHLNIKAYIFKTGRGWCILHGLHSKS